MQGRSSCRPIPWAVGFCGVEVLSSSVSAVCAVVRLGPECSRLPLKLKHSPSRSRLPFPEQTGCQSRGAAAAVTGLLLFSDQGRGGCYSCPNRNSVLFTN